VTSTGVLTDTHSGGRGCSRLSDSLQAGRQALRHRSQRRRPGV